MEISKCNFYGPSPSLFSLYSLSKNYYDDWLMDSEIYLDLGPHSYYSNPLIYSLWYSITSP